MSMKIKNREWIEFKTKLISMLEILGEESDKFDIPEEVENFEIFVDDCEVHPVFIRKDEFLKVEYDFTFCETKIRTLSFSKYRNSARVEISLKENN